jgi:hypothetical protein
LNSSKCGPLAAGILGFVLGAVVVKLVERFCPMCRGEACCCGRGSGCCCGEADCCCEESEGSAEGCCCGDAADSPSDGEAEAPAE